MASGTKNFFIGPEDGWVQVADGTTPAITYMRATSYPDAHPFYLHVGAAAPVYPQVGVIVGCGDFRVGGSETQKVFIKVVKPSATNTANGGKLRIDLYLQGGALS